MFRKNWKRRRKRREGEPVRGTDGKFLPTSTERDVLEDFLDALWSFGIRTRDDNTDQFALKMRGLHRPGGDPHHIFSRRNKGTRWDLDNGILVMGGHGFHEPHTQPELFRTFLIDRWFKDIKKYQALFYRSEVQTKWTVSHLHLLVMSLTSQIRSIITTKPDKVALTEKLDAILAKHNARLDRLKEAEYTGALSKMQGGASNRR